ncbi:hypothetical protein [Burkholderia pseudomallei]|uniref:hypothetical protein n=1 Tax=Burkholderia pseudomallei TaxID=28450 RepID=UPI0005368401|nr:hypothetical protein [Burkholderia pseudomallei]KGV78242.1 hypothetical protein X890_5623 [Burkholderia pseudomallei MSHR4299]
MSHPDLLSYLVASQLTARVRTGRWLPTERLVAAVRAWLACHGMHCEWHDRIRIAIASTELAHGIYAASAGGDASRFAPRFGERMATDALEPPMQALRARCDALLQRLGRD